LIDRLGPRGVKKADAAIDQMGHEYRAEHSLAKIVRSRSGALHGVLPPVRRRGPTNVLNSSTHCGPWQGTVRSLSGSRLTTNSITTGLRCETFFWSESRSERPRRLID
jgi:hypothetical protein